MQFLPIRGRAATLALVGSASFLMAAATTSSLLPTRDVALAADMAQLVPCPTPTFDISQIGVGPNNIFSTPTPVPMCQAPNRVVPPTATPRPTQPPTLAPAAPTPQMPLGECIVDISQIGVGPQNVFGPPTPTACSSTSPFDLAPSNSEVPSDGGSPHVGPLPEPASAEIQANPAGDMPPPAPERDPADEPILTNTSTPPAELALGEYGACFSYGLTMSFSGMWQSITIPTTTYISIEPGNRYTAFALGNNGVSGSFSYQPATGELIWLDGAYQNWPSSAVVDADGRIVIHVKDVSPEGVVTTYRCPLG